jgi:hypothetical protein
LTASSTVAASWAAPSGGGSVTWSSDLAGSTSTVQTVVALQGGAVGITASTGGHVWATTGTPSLTQAGTTTTGADFTITSQAASSGTAGKLILGTGTSTSGQGAIQLKVGATQGTNSSATGVIRLANSVAIKCRNQANTADFNLITSDASNQTIFGDPSAVYNCFNSTSGTIMRGSDFVLQPTNSSINAWRITGQNGSIGLIQADPSLPGVTIRHNDLTTASATGNVFTVQAQNATGTTSTGGSLALTSGTGTTAAGAVKVFAGATQVASLDGTINSYIVIGTGATGVGGSAQTGAIRMSATASTGSTSVAGAINGMRPGGSECTMMRYTTGDALEIGDAGRNGSIGIKSAGNIVADASGGFHMGTGSIVYRNIGGGTVASQMAVVGSGANNWVFQNTITSMDIKFADKTAATSTGIPLQILGNNTTAASGTNVGGLVTITAGSCTGTGTGGDFTFGPGSGSVNGKLVIANYTTATTVGAAGSAASMPTPLGYLVFYLGTTQVKLPYFNP